MELLALNLRLLLCPVQSYLNTFLLSFNFSELSGQFLGFPLYHPESLHGNNASALLDLHHSIRAVHYLLGHMQGLDNLSRKKKYEG